MPRGANVAGMSDAPSPQDPLTGGCACGTVRFAVSAPFETAGYCHCHRCQRRTGTAASLNGRIAARAFAIVAGHDAVRIWQPPDGWPKGFCGRCGGHLFSGDPDGPGMVSVRFGALDRDPGIRAQWRQWVSSAAPWEPIPEDGLPRFAESRPS
jgi:hypothetical protein